MPSKRNENLVKHFDIDIVCNMLVEGKRWADIAKSFKVPVSTLHTHISNDVELSVRAREARKQSADSYAEKAETVLLLAKNRGRANLLSITDGWQENEILERLAIKFKQSIAGLSVFSQLREWKLNEDSF